MTMNIVFILALIGSATVAIIAVYLYHFILIKIDDKRENKLEVPLNYD